VYSLLVEFVVLLIHVVLCRRMCVVASQKQPPHVHLGPIVERFQMVVVERLLVR